MAEKKLRPIAINVVSMGCSKNLVDSERLMKQLNDVGFKVMFEELPTSRKHIDVVVVNTCGFIGDAKEESINTILQWGERRKKGRVGLLCVMGCLSERHGDELKKLIPEVDNWYGKFDWPELVKNLASRHPATVKYDRLLTTPRHHAYLKISEGCNRFCSFCAIPLITGRHKSRPVDEIVAEVELLVGRGVKEFNVIAQDLSSYGTDFPDHKSHLAELIDRISDVAGVEWVRLHYAYPADFPLDVLDVMAAKPNVCKYLDIALQHGSDKVLTNMRRRIDMDATRGLLAEIRRRVPGIHLRTTMMTGFPGEDQEAFDQMMEFVAEQRFERMGAFAYCEEADTHAARTYIDDIPEDVKLSRLERLMALQEEIATELNHNKVGSIVKVIVDREDADYYYGRTQWDSPEVDPEVLIRKNGLKLDKGQFYRVKIVEAMPFDLIGEIAQ